MKLRQLAIGSTLLLIHFAIANATEIRWDAANSFAHSATVAPGKVAEVCGLIEPRFPVQWSFKSDTPLEFNIHRHADKDVIYATKSHLTRELSGTHPSMSAHEWCWMWTNESANTANMTVTLKR
jgi:hypothetical protein